MALIRQGVSTKFDLAITGQGQPRVIIYIDFVESLMVYAKFKDHGTSVVRKEKSVQQF